MTANLPINPDVLKWARKSAELSEKKVADKLGRKGIGADTILAWEKGTGSPNYPQLERLAYIIYKRPLAVFFFPVVPDEETTRTEWRTLPDAALDDLAPGMVKLYRKAKLFQMYLEELYDGALPKDESLLARFALDEQCQLGTFTIGVREALGVPITEQVKWRSAQTAVKRWREAFEDNGIFVFKDAFRNDDYSGFCLYDEKYPIIFLNNSMPDSRQVFTLFHELAHLLYRSGGVDYRSRQAVRSFEGYYRDVEICCNRFANEFLVPSVVLDDLSTEVSEKRFEWLADHFSVSREVILRNYLDRGLVTVEQYEEFAAKWTEQSTARKDKSSGGNPYYNLGVYLGDRYIDLVYARYYQNKINTEALAEYLSVKPKNLSSFEHFVLEGGK